MLAQVLHLADMTGADWAVCATAATVVGLAWRDIKRQGRKWER